MKKIILKFWIINLLISIILYFIYRIVIIEKNTLNDTSFFEKITILLDILLNLYFAIVFLVAMIICSLTFFLNLIEKIRNNYFLSFLTFLGLPIVFVMYLVVIVAIDICTNKVNILGTFLLFSIFYLFIATIEFLLFRKNPKLATGILGCSIL